MKKAFIILSLCLIAFASRGQSIAIAGNTGFEMLTTVESETINIPLKLDNAVFTDLMFTGSHPFAVRNGNNANQRFIDAISFVKIDQPLHLELTVRPSELEAQGNYDVIIEYTLKGKPGYLNLTLQRPVAVLESQTIVISESGICLTADQLALKETGGKAGVSHLVLTDPYVPGIKNGTLITFPKTPVKIAPYGQLSLSYTVDKHLFSEMPLGKTISKMTINSPGMAVPLQVQFEINNTRSKLWIILTVLVGLGVGFIVRHFLKDKRDYEQAVLNAFDLIRDITSYAGRIQDPGFKAAIKVITDAIQAAIAIKSDASSAASATQINAVIDAQKLAYTTLKGNFENSLAAKINDFTSLAAQVYNNTMEKPVQDRLTDAKNTLQLAKEKLDTYDETNGGILMDQATAQVKTGISNFVIYGNTFVAFFNNMGVYYPTGINASIWQEIQNQTASIAMGLSQVVPATSTISSLLAQLNTLQQQMRDLVSYIDKKVLADFETQNGTATADPRFKDAYYHWVSALTDMVANVQTVNSVAFYWAPNLLTALNAVWALLTATPGATKMGNVSNKAFAPAFNLTQKLFAHSTSGQPYYVFSALEIDSLTKSYQTIQANYWRDTIIQSTLLALIICLGVLFTFTSYTGSWNDFINLFFFSFSLDVTVDSIAQFKGKITP